MTKKEEFIVDGYSFSSADEARRAQEEARKINYIKSKIDWNNPEGVLVIYNKLISNSIFSSPFGMNYLRQLHDKLLLCDQIDSENVMSIPVSSNLYGDISASDDMPVPKRRVAKKKIRDYRMEYNICRVIIAVLVACVIAMFAITMKAENPNILNYEIALKNKYATWEQDLTKREQEIRIKEKELGL